MWNADNIANKKIYPGHQYNAKSKKWGPWIKATVQSMGICPFRIQTLHAALQSFCVTRQLVHFWRSMPSGLLV